MRNVAYAKLIGLPYIEPCEPHGRKLAIVGGGPSIKEHIEEIRNFDGDIWAINGVCRYLGSRGIESTMIGVDPHAIVNDWVVWAKKAILCSRTDWNCWNILKQNNADVRIFDLLQENPKGIMCGSSTATGAFHIGTELGYRKIVFYGCESSFELGGRTHAYLAEDDGLQMLVKCGEGEYLTRPDFYVQACEMSKVIKTFPAHFSERSGGLLRAMVENDDHDIIAATQAIHDGLKEI